jgi:enoyl-CoA hydratase/carnithine racemase
MTEFKKLKLELTHAGQVLNLTLNAPKGNVLDREMMTELIAALKENATAPAF